MKSQFKSISDFDFNFKNEIETSGPALSNENCFLQLKMKSDHLKDVIH